MPEIETRTYLGLKFSIFELSDLIDIVKTAIQNSAQLIVFGYSLTIIPKFKKMPQFYVFSNEFDIFLADGRGIYLLFRLLGFRLKSDISIPRFSELLMRLADENQYKVLFFGAKEHVNKKATDIMQARYSSAKICEGISGYFRKEDELKIVDQINQLNPDILLIGISSPIKEEFIHKWKAVLKPRIIVPCGGVIDAFAGETQITPNIIKKFGMAWLYRFLQEPVRLFKPVFLNGLSILFILLPVIIFNLFFKRKTDFSIPRFYGIK